MKASELKQIIGEEITKILNETLSGNDFPKFEFYIESLIPKNKRIQFYNNLEYNKLIFNKNHHFHCYFRHHNRDHLLLLILLLPQLDLHKQLMRGLHFSFFFGLITFKKVSFQYTSNKVVQS